MVVKKLKESLAEAGIAGEDIIALNDLADRDGFELLTESDLLAMIKFIQQNEEDFGRLVPILTDNNSNYLCVIADGVNKGQVYYLGHDEINLTPIFRSIRSLINAVNTYPDVWDITEMPKEAFDFEDLPF